ncbi:hypothetical protein F2Q70_00041044 [Brassica cretica]|uniref:Calcium-transporting P-type ATPase N-terminal autoinhibitory domain-containing protein n=1 Tax=Brassica cretica TaxID=69181 RepID=A0A8S9K6K1_BRACR|nr:hypothetical protein F2Q70_00041044 [Brassica cretica]
MSNLLKDFEVDAKNPSLEARQRWRSSVSIVKNRARRFRMIKNLETDAENDKKRCQIQFLGAFASTVPLSWQHWLLCIVIGAISMILAVGLKCIPVESNSHHDGYELLPSGPSDSA